MVWVAVAIGAAGLLLNVGGALAGGGEKETTSTSRLEFPEETRRLFQDIEEPLLQGSLDEQSALLAPFMGGFRPQPFLQETYGQAPTMALGAARRNAKESGIGDLGSVFESVRGLQPEFIEALRELVLQRGQGIQAIVPPGYGQFLSPSTFTQQSGGGPSAYDTGFQIAGSAANFAGTLFKSGIFK